ncbi:MAG: hypothetical protein HRF47_08405 [Chloroflexota bacterium]|jgi:hypothetical protein
MKTPRSRFFLEWLALNPVGFIFGSLHGATSSGFVPMVIPGMAGLLLGDLIFGAMIGFSQYLVFARTRFLPVTFGWILTHSLGFTLGARAGALLTFRITQDWTMAGIIFGIFMGTSIAFFTAFTLFRKFSPIQSLTWLATCILAWVAGESIAFASNFSLLTVPLIALTIGSITALGLNLLHPYLQTE